MNYLFRNSNSINDFIDPALPLVLGRSLPNETQKQAISRAWWGSRAVLSKGCPWESSDAWPQLLCSLSAAASCLATTKTLQLQRQQNVFFCFLISLTFLLLLLGQNTHRSFSCSALVQGWWHKEILVCDFWVTTKLLVKATAKPVLETWAECKSDPGNCLGTCLILSSEIVILHSPEWLECLKINICQQQPWTPWSVLGWTGHTKQ